jgi:hypothetical protein
MDGLRETYHAESYRVADGELVITEDGSYARRRDERHFPLCNIRTWKAEQP